MFERIFFTRTGNPLRSKMCSRAITMTTDAASGKHRLREKRKRGRKGPASPTPIGLADQVFSSSTVRPRGLRISSIRACISFDGAGVIKLTT